MVPSWAKNGDQNRGRAPLSGDRVKLLIVDKGAERGHLEEIALTCGVTDEVIFTGERHDVAAMLSTFDLFVAYSAQEAFGRSVLDSLANGVPVLHTICPALRGLDVDRARQVLATVSEMPEALAEVTAGHFYERLITNKAATKSPVTSGVPIPRRPRSPGHKRGDWCSQRDCPLA